MVEVKFENVMKKYDDGTIAVNNLNLTVHDGEFLVLVGPSGCGKSTSLRMLAGLEDISDGQITIDGNVSTI
jgi:multiple sugar transport system ATP-binding protein